MGAVISDCGLYRYQLTREISDKPGLLTFIMLNPSTADAEQDDPTIKKCKGFCDRFGFGRLQVLNLFAYRATDPRELKRVTDPVGNKNWESVKTLSKLSSMIICAWGNQGAYKLQNEKIIECLENHQLYALALTKNGHPKHPLYVSYETEPVIFRENNSS